MSCPFDLHSAAVLDAVTLKATVQHGRRETVCRLLARVPLLLPTTRSSPKLSDAYQSQMQVTSVKPNTVCVGEEKSDSSTLYKRRSLTLLDL